MALFLGVVAGLLFGVLAALVAVAASTQDEIVIARRAVLDNRDSRTLFVWGRALPFVLPPGGEVAVVWYPAKGQSRNELSSWPEPGNVRDIES